jgi:hypothetical protein
MGNPPNPPELRPGAVRGGDGDEMKQPPPFPSRSEVETKLLDLIEGRCPREEASEWAAQWALADQPYGVDVEVDDYGIWDALGALLGADLKSIDLISTRRATSGSGSTSCAVLQGCGHNRCYRNQIGISLVAAAKRGWRNGGLTLAFEKVALAMGVVMIPFPRRRIALNGASAHAPSASGEPPGSVSPHC